MPLSLQSFQSSSRIRLYRVLVIAFVVCACAMVAVYAIEGESGPLHQVQRAVHALIFPAQQATAPIGEAIDSAEEAVADGAATEETLSALRDRNAQLTELLTQAEEYRLEAERLRSLLELKDVYKIQGVSARVIGRSTNAWSKTITLDVGTESGLTQGLTVMGPAGVIGQVVEVHPTTAVVRLLEDQDSGVAAMIQSSRVEGIVRGSLSGVLRMENVAETAVVNQGDVVLTSGLGGSFTKGLLIGTVARVEGNASDGTRVIVVAPNEVAQSLEEVIVVFSASETAHIIKKDMLAEGES